jgi:hypothetical protein
MRQWQISSAWCQPIDKKNRRGINMSVTTVQTNNQAGSINGNITAEPLNPQEKKQFSEAMKSAFGLTQAQCDAILSNLPPQQIRTYLALASGEDEITRQEAQDMWGLTDEETNGLFGERQSIGTFGNPFGDVFLNMLMLTYAMGLDLKKLVSDMVHGKKNYAIEAARERLNGATVQFAFAMAAAVLTIGMAAINMWGATHPKTTKGADGQAQNQARWMDNNWFGPFGVQLGTAPLNAIGEYVNATYRFEGEELDAKKDYAASMDQQLQALLDGYIQGDNSSFAALNVR